MPAHTNRDHAQDRIKVRNNWSTPFLMVVLPQISCSVLYSLLSDETAPKELRLLAAGLGVKASQADLHNRRSLPSGRDDIRVHL